MIPELRNRFFISLAQKAKHLSKNGSLPKPHKHSILSRREKIIPEISHLTLKNQRRIKRLRARKSSDSEVLKVLRQEVREHKLTRDQLHAAIDYLKHEHYEYKQIVSVNAKKITLLHNLRAQLEVLRARVDELPSKSRKDKSSIELRARVAHIESLIKKKELEFGLDLK